MIGSMVFHYRITGKIGEGGMGVVYKAEDTKLQRTVALKFLPSASIPESARQRFVQEARASARIQHPNVCPIFEINEFEGRLFFAMAFVEGKTILDLLQAGPLPISQALGLGIQIARGLETAHRLGIVHRDIKSGNIVIDQHGSAVILDFGLALQTDGERLTVAGATSGTPGYMSPEQAQGFDVDQRTDLWSLGVVLFEMLTGVLPFQRNSQIGVLYAIVNQDPVAVSTLRPQVPRALEAILNKALAKDPGQRWQSAAEMAAAIRRLLDAESQQTQIIEPVANVSQADPSRAASSGRGWKFAVAAPVLLAILLLFAAIAYLAFRRSHAPVAALPDLKQIAVLPLRIIGDQNDQTVRALADGLVETLTAKLSQVGDFQGKLLVVPASEIRNRKITDVEAARRIYNANLALTGSAQRWGDKIQFNEVLVDAVTISQLGSTSFEFEADKATDIRDRAVDGAVKLLALKLMPATVTALDSGETAAPAAYGDYLKGVGFLTRYDVTGNVDRAIGSLENAISADPKYALAHAALGEAHWRKAKQTSDKKEAALALDSIQLALRLDPGLTAAHIKLGEIYSESGEPERAISEEKTALQTVPASAQAYRALGAAYSAINRFSEAQSAYQQGIKCQPTDWYGYNLLGFFYVQRGRLAEARTAYDTAHALTPDNEVVLRNLAILDMREGKFEDAANLYTKSAKSEPSAKTFAVLGLAYYYEHRFAEAAANLNSSLKLDPTVYPTWGNLGTVYRHLPGNQDKARQAFLKAIELANKTLEVLHDDPRAHANLAEYWAKLGDSKKALAEIDQIPPAARGPFIDRVVLVYEFSGDRRRAMETLLTIPQNSPVINYLRNDPDLEGVWSSMPAAKSH